MAALSGSLLNAGAILIGSMGGLLLHRIGQHRSRCSPASDALPQRMQTTIMQGIALCILCIGVSGALKGRHMLLSILSMTLGAAIGEVLDLDRRVQRFGDWIEHRTSSLLSPHSASSLSFSQGWITASLTFCVGSMSIVGALENGLTGNSEMLQAKSLLDGISALIFAASLGFGVLLSAGTVLIWEGGIALLASVLAPYLTQLAITELTCTGSMLMVALALNMLGVTRIKVMNLIPAVFLPVLFCQFL